MLSVWVKRIPHHAFCQVILLGCFAIFLFAFCSCLLIFCFRPLSLSFLPLSPIAYLLFPCSLCLKSRSFHIIKPFFLILSKCDYCQISPPMIFPCLLNSTGSLCRGTSHKKTRKEAVLSSLRVSPASQKDSLQLDSVSLYTILC